MTALLTKDEVARLLGVSPRTIDAWTQSGKLRVVKTGRLNRYLMRDVERFLNLKAGTLGQEVVER